MFNKSMGKSSTLATFLFLTNLVFMGHALFEYVCDEKQLYRPYVHVYKERRGSRIMDLGPGFHGLAEHMNVYVCINGIAYLYFSKNTELGEVFEAPQLKKYAHTCEMYNVQPREGSASIVEVQLHLRAILLLGDPVDYRRPSIQKFTAPYYFRKDQVNVHLPNDTEYVQTPAMYLNASSMVIIGQSECTLVKGQSKDTLIKVRPHIFPPSQNGTDSYLCKIGFQSLLEKATTPPKGPIPSEEDRAPALALINDAAIRVEKCAAPSTFDPADSSFDTISAKIGEIKDDYETKKDELLEKFNSLVDAVLGPLRTEKEKLEAKKEDNSTNTKHKDLKRLDKQLAKVELRMKTEEDKKVAFSKTLDGIVQGLTNLTQVLDEAKPDGTKATTAKTDREASETAKTEWETIKDQKPPAQETEIDAKKQAYDEARRKAKASAREYQWALSELEVRHLRLKKLVEKIKRLQAYMPSYPSKGKRASSSLNPEGATSVIIEATEENCEPLPVLEGEEGECMKGKPDKNESCSLFQSTLGVYDVWKDGIEPRRNDTWKKEVLELIGSIFATACDKIKNVKKFVKLNNRVMQYYLTNENLFNLKPNLTTDTCINFRFSRTLRELDGNSGPSQLANLTYMEETRFWSTIKYVLSECKIQSRRLSFRENKTGSGNYKFIKNFGFANEEELDVLFHQEQADIEYAFNWPIDMNWKMFATVMGLCMPSYEWKVPLITSRFFSLYTEYFLIPLRETWINPKDNILFQFIMGEFYNSHTEFWGDMCMEGAFIYAGQRDYRPPRSLMVNCASEHNYFVNGEFTKVPVPNIKYDS